MEILTLQSRRRITQNMQYIQNIQRLYRFRTMTILYVASIESKKCICILVCV